MEHRKTSQQTIIVGGGFDTGFGFHWGCAFDDELTAKVVDDVVIMEADDADVKLASSREEKGWACWRVVLRDEYGSLKGKPSNEGQVK